MNGENLFNLQLKINEASPIGLDEIDSEIIPSVRELKLSNSEYDQLKNSIEKDGQQQPIIIRKLTDKEQADKNGGATYGIIDGHHRFEIAKALNKKEILAVIDEGLSSSVRDMILAMRFNVSSIKMTTVQKGKVLYEILETLKDSSNKEVMREIGEKLFGLREAMTYRCLRAYKISISEHTVDKPRENKIDISEIHDLLQKLPNNLNDIDNLEKSDGESYIKTIQSIETQLRSLKKKIAQIVDKKNS